MTGFLAPCHTRGIPDKSPEDLPGGFAHPAKRLNASTRMAKQKSAILQQIDPTDRPSRPHRGGAAAAGTTPCGQGEDGAVQAERNAGKRNHAQLDAP